MNIEVYGLKSAIRKLEKTAEFDLDMKQVSGMMYDDVIEHFSQEKGPTGAWAGIKRKGKILQKEGALRGSILPGVSRFAAWVSTNLIYARTHNQGDPSRNIKQREFMYLSKQARQKIKSFVVGRIGR